jgi:hypothetical protein
MKSKVSLLFPFDMGLELDFTGKDAREFFKEISARRMGVLTAEGRTFSETEFSTQVYRFGVGIIQVTFEVDGDLTFLANLSCRIESIHVGKMSILAYCESLVEGMIQRATKYATYRYEQRLTENEILPIFVFSEQPARNAEDFILRHQKALFGLLAGEANYDALSSFVLDRDKISNYGYYENELILIKRFGAAVFSQESSTILEMIKLAYAQYWSMRSYNFLLDHELETSQRLLEKLPPYYKFWLIPQAYQRFSNEAMDFDRDKISIVDSLYNVVANIPKVESDWHLRTLHQTVNKVFNIEDLHRTVEMKIERIEESYNSAREFLSTNFFLLLDFIFFLSLAWSVFDTWLLWKMAQK